MRGVARPVARGVSTGTGGLHQRHADILMGTHVVPAPVLAQRPGPAVDITGQRRRIWLRTLHGVGWRERLAPLASHLAAGRLVRGCSESGASLRQLNLDVLRRALCEMLARDDDAGELIYRLVVQGADAAHVAAQPCACS
ncbi:MAG TPA: hypothetical protein VJY65_06140 [Chloroflexota bacterium]|nr:hypothetical protein [Chloroflexota bacterium]